RAPPRPQVLHAAYDRTARTVTVTRQRPDRFVGVDPKRAGRTRRTTPVGRDGEPVTPPVTSTRLHDRARYCSGRARPLLPRDQPVPALPPRRRVQGADAAVVIQLQAR